MGSSSKRRQTMEKMTRERTVKERRAKKLEKKQAAAIAKRTGVPVAGVADADVEAPPSPVAD
jgi:hypothetical protein